MPSSTPTIPVAEYRRMMAGGKPTEPIPARVKRVRSSEHDEQCALMELVRLHQDRISELLTLYAIPNQRHSKGEAGRLKAEGAKAGVWDLHLPVPRAPYHGLWIEMKVGKNVLTVEQRRWRALMQSYGHRCEVCYSAEAAWKAIRTYLNNMRPVE